MKKETRRGFIQKSILSGAFFSLGIPFLKASNNLDSKTLDSGFKLENTNYKSIDWTKIRNQFLFPKDRQYLNTASLGPSPRMVIDTICKTIEKLETTCSHGHNLTKKTHTQIAAFLNTSLDEIAVIRNATEGMNIIARTLRLKAGDEVIILSLIHI